MVSYKVFILFIGLGLTQGSISEVAEEVQQARKNQLSDFTERMAQLSNCGEEINTISSKVSAFRNALQTNVCEYVATVDVLKECIEFQKTSVDQIKTLIKSVIGAQGRCYVFNTQELFVALSQMQNNMEKDLRELQGKYRWMMEQGEDQKPIFNSANYVQCNLQTHSKWKYMMGWQLKVNMSQSDGDVYAFQEGLSALRVLNSYITAKANTCKQHIGEAQDSGARMHLEGMEQTVQRSQEALNGALAQSQELNIDEWVQRQCEKFRKNNHNIEICENPINTPSWFYTIHHLHKTFFLED